MLGGRCVVLLPLPDLGYTSDDEPLVQSHKTRYRGCILVTRPGFDVHVSIPSDSKHLTATQYQLSSGAAQFSPFAPRVVEVEAPSDFGSDKLRGEVTNGNQGPGVSSKHLGARFLSVFNLVNQPVLRNRVC